MEKLRAILSELKSTVSSKRIAIVKHFDDIRNKIDIGRQAFLEKNCLTVEDKEKAIQQQTEMMNEVDLLQRQCLSNLEKVRWNISGVEDSEQL